MSADYDDIHGERLDRATRQRLAKLASIPVDTSRLERRLLSVLGKQDASPAWPVWSRRWPAWSGLAAAIVLLASVIFTTIGTESATVAAPVKLAQMHQAIVSGAVPMEASDIDGLRRILAAGWPGRSSLSELPSDLTHNCCLQSLDGKPVLGVLLRHGDTPISVLVADADQVRAAKGGREVARDGRRYSLHEVEGTGMATVEEDGRLLCFMGTMPTSELIKVADQTLGNRN